MSTVVDDPATVNAPLLVSVEKAASLLGVSARTIHRLVVEGTLPHVRVGRRLLLSVASLEAWISDHEVPAGASLAGNAA